MIRPATSLVALAATAALVATPATANAALPGAFVNPIAQVQSLDVPDLGSVAGVIGIPLKNLDQARSTLIVQQLDGKGVGVKDPTTGKPVMVNIIAALQGEVNRALKGDTAAATANTTSYLTTVAVNLKNLPGDIWIYDALTLNQVLPFDVPGKPSWLPSTPQVTVATAALKAVSSAAPSASALDVPSFDLPSLPAAAGVIGIPLKNLDQARLSAFVVTGYAKKNGQYVDKDGNPLTYFDPETGQPIPDDAAHAAQRAQYVQQHAAPITANILAALSGALNAALAGDTAGAFSAAQSYVTQFAGNVVNLPGDMWSYDFKTLNAAFPAIPNVPSPFPTSPGYPWAQPTAQPQTIQTFSVLDADQSSGDPVSSVPQVKSFTVQQEQKPAPAPKNWLPNLKTVFDGQGNSGSGNAPTGGNDKSGGSDVKLPTGGNLLGGLFGGGKDGKSSSNTKESAPKDSAPKDAPSSNSTSSGDTTASSGSSTNDSAE